MARRARRIPKPWPKVKRVRYPKGWPSNLMAVLYLNGRQAPTDTAGPAPDPYGPEIAPVVDFDVWWLSTWSVVSHTKDSFTNNGTAAAIVEVPEIEVGSTYEVTAEVEYGAGALRFTTADSYDTRTGNPEHTFSGTGTETFQLVFETQLIMFRISTANTTSSLKSLSIRKVLDA